VIETDEDQQILDHVAAAQVGTRTDDTTGSPASNRVIARPLCKWCGTVVQSTAVGWFDASGRSRNGYRCDVVADGRGLHQVDPP